MIYYDIITLLDSPAIPRKIRRMLQNPNVNNDMTKEKIEYVINKLIRSNNNAVILPPFILLYFDTSFFFFGSSFLGSCPTLNFVIKFLKS